jgi:hypothetical protein
MDTEFVLYTFVQQDRAVRPLFSTFRQLLNCHNSCNCQTLTTNVILFGRHLSLIWYNFFTKWSVLQERNTFLYTSWNLYFIKQHHQTATIDIQKVWHLLSKFHSCNCCDSWATVRVEKYGLIVIEHSKICYAHCSAVMFSDSVSRPKNAQNRT